MAEMLHTIRGWRSQHKKLAEDAGQLLRDAGDDPLGGEAEERFEAIHGEIDALTARIERSERQHDLEASLAQSAGPQIGLRDWGAPVDHPAGAENRQAETRVAGPRLAHRPRLGGQHRHQQRYADGRRRGLRPDHAREAHHLRQFDLEYPAR